MEDRFLEEVRNIANGPHNKAPMGLKRLMMEMTDNWGIKNVNDNYREVVKNSNEKYYKSLEGLDDESMNYIFPSQIKNRELAKIREYIDTIDDIIRLRTIGCTREAYNQFYDLMADGKGDMWGMLQRKLDNGENNLYRIRLMSSHNNTTRSELFHIPLNQRYLVKTCRFSHPGYPCLYLGSSINVCWEELGRPDLSDFMVVRVGQQVGGIKVIDLSLPSDISQLYLDDIWKFIKAYPFIVACGIKVNNPSEKSYKEEYIIPQMLTEYIIENNQKAVKNKVMEEITGIKYTSTHYNKDFYSNLDKFTNIAIPVVDIEQPNGYCSKLRNLFLLTKPTCFSYEFIKGKLFDTTFNKNLWERMENILVSRPLDYID